MICKGIKRFCKDYAKIENYDKAIVDTTQVWQCHHRLETHNSDGERRLVDLSKEELIALDMYYDRPPEELIFLKSAEHVSLHHKGKPSISKGMKGKHHSEEAKRKISEALKGRIIPSETIRKRSESFKGNCWFNDGKVCIRAKECPEGFVPGRLKWKKERC